MYSLSYIAFSGPGSLQLVLVMIITSADTDLKGLKLFSLQPALCATWVLVFHIVVAF